MGVSIERVFAGIACALAAGLVALSAHAAEADELRGARGLIVKLRDSSTDTGRSEALAARPDATRPAARGETLRRLAADAGLKDVRVRPVGRGFGRVDAPGLGATGLAQLAAQLRARPEVEWVVPNARERLLQTPTDPQFTGQWWLFPSGGSNANNISDRRRGVAGVQSAWSTETGKNIVIAVLDTGITGHPDLGAQVLPGRDFVSEVEYANDGDGWDADAHDPGDWVSATDKSANPALFGTCDVVPSSWHGTAIAGILAATVNNNVGIASVNWAGRILPVRVAGKCGAELAEIVDGMRWAAGLEVLNGAGQPLPLNPNPARIINISFGGSDPCNALYQDTIDELRAIGVLVVAAAGNESSATVTRPASCTGVLGVAALNRDGFKSTYSNFGAPVAIATVGGDPRTLGAWGPDLGDDGLLTLSNDGAQGPDDPIYLREFGTSFSAPTAAGVAGLMLSVNGALTVDQLIDGIRRSARPHVTSPSIGACSAQNPGRCLCSTSTCGAGILDAPRALSYAANPAGYVATPLTPASIDNADVTAAVALGPDLPGSGSGGGSSSGGGGGGALGALWLAGLALAVAALRRRAKAR
jgi:serine protease